ncbi:hypothetical protein DFA_04117 [Cavenderia fasciculata]|uniref:Uncharacterized protein n=1 Tax=Cavenderia fasciculata TaxID=261658 RepID=F4Q1C1_CACFS|nr:uncharacterized protein DFA_04117 [Cavenderia fasciculata]EGG18622.1 hypothetical protein DFA_04117 [Cavenderia fasciculata]|eukprot:XP_004366526.1 hypothetical protein DFA_04117 [Cavenderia fasciculata]
MVKNAKWSRKEGDDLISIVEQIKRENPERVFSNPQLAIEIKKVETFSKFTEPQLINKIKRNNRKAHQENKRVKYSGEFSGSTTVTDNVSPPIAPLLEEKRVRLPPNRPYQEFLDLHNISQSTKLNPTPYLYYRPTTTSTRNVSTPSAPQISSSLVSSSTQYLNPKGPFSGSQSATTLTTHSIPFVDNNSTIPSNQITKPVIDDNILDSFGNNINNNNNNNNNNSMFISFYGQSDETLTIYLPLCIGETFKHTITPSGDIIVQVFRSDYSCSFTKTKKLPHSMSGSYKAYFKRPLDYGMPVLATNKAYKDMYVQEICGFTFKREIKEISEEVEL